MKQYINTGFIVSQPMDEKEESRIKAIISEVRPVVYNLAQEIYGTSKIKRFRLDFYAGILNEQVTPYDRTIINRLREVENRLLSAFASLAVKQAKKFAGSRTHPALDYDDYFDEACMAITDIAWSYDGSTKMITYVQTAVFHRLQSAAKLGPLSMIHPDDYRLRGKIYRKVNQGTKIDNVLEEMGLKGEDAIHARRVMTNTIHVSQFTNENTRTSFDVLDDSYSDCNDTIDLLVKMTPLSPLQRDLLDAFLQGVKGFQTAIVKRNKDSRTGESYRKDNKSYTRAYAQQQWKDALKALKKTYERLEAKAA